MIHNSNPMKPITKILILSFVFSVVFGLFLLVNPNGAQIAKGVGESCLEDTECPSGEKCVGVKVTETEMTFGLCEAAPTGEAVPESQPTVIKVTGNCKCTAVDPALEFTVSGTGGSEDEAKNEAKNNCYDECYTRTGWSNAVFTPTETTTGEEGGAGAGAGAGGAGAGAGEAGAEAGAGAGPAGVTVGEEKVAEAKLQSPIRFETPLELINAIISAILGVIGILSVIFIIWGGYGYIMAGGSEERVQEAKKTITYAIIGLVLSIGAYIIINTIIKAIGG